MCPIRKNTVTVTLLPFREKERDVDTAWKIGTTPSSIGKQV